MNTNSQAVIENPVEYAIQTQQLNLWYGTFQALFDIDLDIKQGIITSLIGPSGCGKSTFLRSVNRINERLGYVRIEGSINVSGHDVYDPAVELVSGHDVYDPAVELVQVRKQIGMVFQRPNPLPISIRDNVLFGYKLHASGKRTSRSEQDDIAEDALRQVLLWDKVKDKLDSKGTELSLEEQQKLCIARLLPVKPGLLLMDEPCRQVHHPHRHPQHGPGTARQRRMYFHADGQGRGTHCHRGHVRHTRQAGNGRLHRRPLRLAAAARSPDRAKRNPGPILKQAPRSLCFVINLPYPCLP